MTFDGACQTAYAFSYLLRRSVREVQSHMAGTFAGIFVGAVIGIDRIARHEHNIQLHCLVENGPNVQPRVRT